MAMTVILEADNEDRYGWHFVWSLSGKALISEVISMGSKRKLNVLVSFGRKRGGRGEGGDVGKDGNFLSFEQYLRPGGSSLSILDLTALPPGLALSLGAVRRWAEGVVSLELLSPVAMRRGSRGIADSIGPRGERLGGFLASLPADRKDRLIQRLGRFYPLTGLDTVRKRAGWIDLKLQERYPGLNDLNASQVSDGFMRLLGLAAIPEFGAASLVLLDEIEDGIDPHILGRFVHLIADESEAQLLLTSHSPTLVNSFEPTEIAFMARDETEKEAPSIAVRFDEVEDLKGDLEYLGPGEVWAQTDLETTSQWVREVAQKKRERSDRAGDRHKSIDQSPLTGDFTGQKDVYDYMKWAMEI